MGRIRIPPLNALRAFEVVARTSNARIAAEELGVTQGAVAQHIRALEEHLDVRLFERTPRGLVLTEAGRYYAAPLAHAFDLIGEATRGLPTRRRTVTISLPPSLAAKWLLPRLRRFHAEHSDIDLSVVATSALMNFGRDGVDLAIRYGPGRYSGVISSQLRSIELVPVCSTALLSEHDLDGTGEKELDLSDLPLLHDVQKHNERIVYESYWEEWFRGLGSGHGDLLRGTRFNMTSLAIDAACLGVGVALVPSLLVEADLAEGRLVAVSSRRMPIDWAYHLVEPPNPDRRPEVLAVHAWMRRQAAVGGHSGAGTT